VSRVKLASSHIAAAIAGAVIGAVLVLGVDGLTRTVPPSPATPQLQEPLEILPGVHPASARVLLAWSPLGVPASLARSLDRMSVVERTTIVEAGLDWIVSTRSADGTESDRMPNGYGIPMELAVISPRAYAPFVPASERDRILRLRSGEILLARTAAALRAATPGAVIRLGDGRALTMTASVSDQATQGYEGLIAGPVPRSWARADRFVLTLLRRGQGREAVERRIRAVVGPGHVLRIRAQGETPFLRYGDAVLPQMLVKKTFGEFSARSLGDGSIEIEPQWKQQNLVTQRVPLLGRVQCHAAIFPQLRGAIQEVIDSGLAFAINPEQFGGCYGPRFIDRNPGGRLSHHSWGIAVDVNVAENIPGTKPDQDRRLVEIFEDHGFTWGGRWLIPDGMHFEWVAWP